MSCCTRWSSRRSSPPLTRKRRSVWSEQWKVSRLGSRIDASINSGSATHSSMTWHSGCGAACPVYCPGSSSALSGLGLGSSLLSYLCK
eukprot:scaffold48624_cov63-Phaeocystis_antarctica.AAC.5